MGNGDSSLGFSVSACAVVMAASVGGPVVLSPADADAAQAVESYCNASWNNARVARQDWADCTQETFVRLLERISRERLVQAVVDAKSRERRELNRCIWCVAQRWRRCPRHYPLNFDDVPDRRTAQAQFPRTLAEIREMVHDSTTGLTSRQRWESRSRL